MAYETKQRGGEKEPGADFKGRHERSKETGHMEKDAQLKTGSLQQRKGEVIDCRTCPVNIRAKATSLNMVPPHVFLSKNPMFFGFLLMGRNGKGNYADRSGTAGY